MYNKDEFIERDICIGLITDADYLRQVIPIWNPRLIESTSARIICGWCIDYGRKYTKAPQDNIETLYVENITSFTEDTAKSIEGILNSLNGQFETNLSFNTDFLLERTERYFKKRNLLILAEQIKIEAENDDIKEAEKLACGFLPVQRPEQESVDPFNDPRAVKFAFSSRAEPLFSYPKSLGQFWNYQFVKEGFVAFLGREKIGKTYLLMDVAFHALRRGLKVAFFSAGDMSEPQMIRRQGIYLTHRSDMEKHCGELLVPVLDCKLNQNGECDLPERQCQEFVPTRTDDLRSLRMAANYLLKNPNGYQACRNCEHIDPTIWYRIRPPVNPLEWKEAYTAFKNFRSRYPNSVFRLSSHTNETLTVSHIRWLLDMWENLYNFRADVIIVDYADILAPDPDMPKEFRHFTNKIWQRLSALRQERKCLVVTATQADAKSYDIKSLLRLTNFSEDKRKYSHVTAFYGLNQTPDEKVAGVLKINELLLREDEFDSTQCVHVLQSLRTGRPVIGSFFEKPVNTFL